MLENPGFELSPVELFRGRSFSLFVGDVDDGEGGEIVWEISLFEMEGAEDELIFSTFVFGVWLGGDEAKDEDGNNWGREGDSEEGG